MSNYKIPAGGEWKNRYSYASKIYGIHHKTVGEWMKKYGETIYGTRGGPVTPKSWGVTTAKGNLVYVHLLNPESETLLLPEFGKKVKKAYLFDDNSKVDFKQDGFGTVIKVPSARLHEIDTIVVIEI